MVVELNRYKPTIGEKIVDNITSGKIYNEAIITKIEDDYIFLDNFTCMDMRMYRYITGKIVGTPSRKLSTDEYLPLVNEDHIWYSYPTKKWSFSDELEICKVYKCLKLVNYWRGEYNGASMALYNGGSDIGNYQYFKRV